MEITESDARAIELLTASQVGTSEASTLDAYKLALRDLGSREDCVMVLISMTSMFGNLLGRHVAVTGQTRGEVMRLIASEMLAE